MTTRTKILVIDDEPSIRKLLRVLLSANGFTLLEASSGQEGLTKAAQEQPEVILLDLGLPDKPGIQVLRELREWSHAPVVILSVRDREQQKVEALDAGADDYLTKPFGPNELLARIRSVLRRSNQPSGEPIFEGDRLKVDFAARLAYVDGQELKLTAKEYALLTFLVKNAGKVLTHQQILKEVWGSNSAENTHYLRVYISHLRDKIERDPSQPNMILTEPGVGYRLVVKDSKNGY